MSRANVSQSNSRRSHRPHPGHCQPDGGASRPHGRAKPASPTLKTIPLKIFDETLRDGEQQAGVFFDYETKHTLAHLIAKAGVSYIDIMPFVDRSEEQLVKALISEGLSAVVSPAVMMGKRFIDHARSCGARRIILFHAVSDRLMFLRDAEARRSHFFGNRSIDDGIPDAVIAQVRREVLDKIQENLRYATSEEVGLEVDFAAEDASRADPGFLIECIRKFRPYVGHFMLCDTVGTLSPEKTYNWVHDLLGATDHAPLAVHFHNDLGMALENTIQGVLAGATMVSGTFLGIGERAGNVALEQVFNGLRVRFGVEVEGIDYESVEAVTESMRGLGVAPAPPYSATARRHETGIHVNSFLRDPKSYSIFAYEEPEIWFGKCSGASNFQYLFEKRLSRTLPAEAYDRMRTRIKELSIEQKRCFSSEEVLRLIEGGALDG
jgi:isopropylmalate/homocitrate/citramalate synthase